MKQVFRPVTIRPIKPALYKRLHQSGEFISFFLALILMLYVLPLFFGSYN